MYLSSRLPRLKKADESVLFDFEGTGKGTADFSGFFNQSGCSPEDEGAGQMKMLYCSCPSEMRETLLHHTQETMKELTELSEKFETN